MTYFYYSNDYTNRRGELVPLDNVDSVHRQDLIEAFDEYAPAYDDQPIIRLAIGIISVVAFLVIIATVGA